MQPEHVLQPGAKAVKTQRILIVVALVAYSLAVLGGALPTFGAALLSAIALAALGGALFVYVVRRVGPVAAQRLGGRAQAAQRRYRRLAYLSLALVYMTLIAGTLMTYHGALWSCLRLPTCDTTSELANLAMGHRAMAALAAALVIVLSVLTLRTRSVSVLRRAAKWVIVLMSVQVVVGLLQVALAASGDSPIVYAVRIGHLAVGTAAWSALVLMVAYAMRLPLETTKDDRLPQTVAPHEAAHNQWMALIKDYISLTKPGVITLLILTTIVSMYITPVGAPNLWLVFWTFVGGWMMAAGAHSVNCWADQDIDVNMGRTSRRPIPSGRIPAWHALVLGLILGGLAFTILVVFVNLAAALLSLAGYLYYVLIYTRWLKRTTPSNIVIGGGAGAFPPLVGWAAATGGLTLSSLFLFAIVFYWTPPHFWALALIREKDYARANVPMLPVVAGEQETKRQILFYTILMFILTILPTPLQMFGLPYLVIAVVLGAIFMFYVIQLMRVGTTATAWRLYSFSLLYLALLFMAMVVDRMVFA